MIAESPLRARDIPGALGRTTKGSIVAMIMLVVRFDRSRTLRLHLDNAQHTVNTTLTNTA